MKTKLEVGIGLLVAVVGAELPFAYLIVQFFFVYFDGLNKNGLQGVFKCSGSGII